MAQQLAYVLITPYTLHKSRTGGIIARLITRTGLDLVAARMFAPSAELVRQYSDEIVSAADPQDRRIQELIRDYILANLGPDLKSGRHRRVMMLLFPGEEAVRKIRSVIGNITAHRRGGETIRDTYGDLILDDHDEVRYFEPAVLAPPPPAKPGSNSNSGRATPTPTAAWFRTPSPISPAKPPNAPSSSSSPTTSVSPPAGPATSLIFFPAPAFTLSASKSIA